jgi:tubulin---tyrosine ligase
MKINQSNNAIIPFPKASFTPYKYYIGRGNNSILVRNCLKSRFWWSMGDFEDWDEYNFIWTQWKANKIVAKIKTNKDMIALSNEENGLGTKSGLSGKDGAVGTSDSMLSTDRDSNSSAETLLATPTKRKRVATAILSTSQNSAIGIKKNVSASKPGMIPGKPGVAVPGAAGVEEKEKKETSHHMLTYNHMENNYHLSNKKALYYNMKIYYESVG